MTERDEGYAEPVDLDDEPDFAEEHHLVWVEADTRRDVGETESPHGHAGLEATIRPN